MGGEMKVCQIGKEMLGTEERIPIDFIQPGFVKITIKKHFKMLFKIVIFKSMH